MYCIIIHLKIARYKRGLFICMLVKTGVIFPYFLVHLVGTVTYARYTRVLVISELVISGLYCTLNLSKYSVSNISTKSSFDVFLLFLFKWDFV